MSRPLAPQPMHVVLPLLGDPLPLLAAVTELVERWPAEVDARLVVASAVLGPRDRALVAQLGEDVLVVEVPGTPVFGELVAGAAAGDAPVLVLDPANLPSAESLAQLTTGGGVAGGLLVSPAVLTGTPVLSAACSLDALGALLVTLEPVPPVKAEAAAPRVATLSTDVAVRAGLVSVVLPVSGSVEHAKAALSSLRRGAKVPLEVLVVDAGAPLATRAWLAAQRDLTLVPAGGSGLVADVDAALRTATGDALVLLDELVALPRFWAEGLLRTLQEEGVVAVGPRAPFLPAEQHAEVGAHLDADAWRRQHAGTSSTASRLDDACLVLRRSALREAGLLDEALQHLPVAVAELLLRLQGTGGLRVADDVLVQRSSPRPLSPETLTADLQHVLAVHGTTLGRPAWLSAALIVKDEQAALPACLAALRGVVDEVVVCDTGSTDRTVEVAEAFGARLVHAPWTGDFAAARNVALASCRGAWVLSVDADEQLSVAAGADLRRQLLALDGATDAATLLIRSRNQEESGATFEHLAGRLFRRTGLQWVGAVHESLTYTRTSTPPRYLPTGAAWLDHDGYLGRVYEARDKGSRNLLLAEKDHAQALADGSASRRWKTAYELGRALSKDDGNEERVEALMREALVDMPREVGHLRCDAQVRLATAVARQGRLDEAEQCARAALVASPGDPAALLVLGEVIAATGRHEDALRALEAPTGRDSAIRDLQKADVDLPLLRARLLHALDRDQDALPLLLVVAERAPESLDWPLLHEVLRGEPAGATTLAGLVAATPEAALAGLDGLPDADRAPLFTAVRALGVDPEEHTPAALRARRLDQVLQGHDPRSVAQAALALEDTDPTAALDLWSRVPVSAVVQVARARCLLQLGRTEEALSAVDGLDVDALELADLLVVVALAAAAGDRETAQGLLDRVEQVPDTLRETVDTLAASLGLVV